MMRVVIDRATWDDFSAWMAARDHQVLGLDSETNGADPWAADFRLRAVQVSDGLDSWVVDIARVSRQRLAQAICRHPAFVAHFSEAEVRFLSRGLPGSLRLHEDTPHVCDFQVVLAWLDPRTVIPAGKDGMDPRLARPKGLKPTATRELGGELENAQADLYAWFREHAPKGHRTPARMKAWGFANIPFDTPEYIVYAALDPRETKRLWDMAVAKLGQRGAIWSDLCTQWDIDRATCRGLPVDGPYARALAAQLDHAISRRTGALAAHGVKSTGMGPQVGQALERLGVRSPKRTGGGAACWDSSVLKVVAKSAHPVAADLALSVLAVRQATKFGAAYVQPMITALTRDGRVHCSMRAVGTVTSRMSASGPALQQLPKKDTRVRAAYGGVDGWVFVSGDFAQGEPRTMAALSGDPNYVAAVASGDINTVLATETFGSAFNPAEGKTAGTPSYLLRQRCKAGFLAECYGAGLERLADTLGVPVEQAREIKQRWRSTYAAMFARADRLNGGTCVRLENGWVAPLWDRFRVGDEGQLLLDSRPSRKAMNYETQGTQRVHLVRAWRALVSRGWAWALALFLHDEILLHVPEWMAETARRDLEECMTMSLSNGVTMLCEATIDGRTWLPQTDQVPVLDLAEYVDSDSDSISSSSSRTERHVEEDMIKSKFRLAV